MTDRRRSTLRQDVVIVHRHTVIIPIFATIMCCELFTNAFFLLETIPVKLRLFLVKTYH